MMQEWNEQEIESEIAELWSLDTDRDAEGWQVRSEASGLRLQLGGRTWYVTAEELK